MKWAILGLRLGGYLTGVLGVVLMLSGQRHPDSRNLISMIGGICLVAMFVFFFISFILQFVQTLHRSSTRRSMPARPVSSPPSNQKSPKTGIDRTDRSE